MAVGDPIPPDRVIYRAIRTKQLNADKTINEIAFFLKPAHGEYPDETYLSFGIDISGAIFGLQNIRYVAKMRVAEIIALGLTVVEDNDPQKIQVAGMPLPKDDDVLATQIAKALRNKANLIPIE